MYLQNLCSSSVYRFLQENNSDFSKSCNSTVNFTKLDQSKKGSISKICNDIQQRSAGSEILHLKYLTLKSRRKENL